MFKKLLGRGSVAEGKGSDKKEKEKDRSKASAGESKSEGKASDSKDARRSSITASTPAAPSLSADPKAKKIIDGFRMYVHVAVYGAAPFSIQVFTYSDLVSS